MHEISQLTSRFPIRQLSRSFAHIRAFGGNFLSGLTVTRSTDNKHITIQHYTSSFVCLYRCKSKSVRTVLTHFSPHSHMYVFKLYMQLKQSFWEQHFGGKCLVLQSCFI